MNLTTDIEVACDSDDVPDPDSIIGWLRATLGSQSISLNRSAKKICECETEVSIRIVSKTEIQHLNAHYRHKNTPTNVLSFPAYSSTEQMPNDLPMLHLGDIVICAAVVNEEAQQQDKSLSAHWAHMVVHGTLHLLGYDHELDSEAVEMENLEIDILHSLNFPSPYEAANAVHATS